MNSNLQKTEDRHKGKSKKRIDLDTLTEKDRKVFSRSSNVKKTPEDVFLEKMEDVLPLIVDIVKRSHAEMWEEVDKIPFRSRFRNTKCTRMTERLRDNLFEVFSDKTKELKYGRIGLLTDNYVMLFKKLSGGKPSNIPTKNARKLLAQCKLNFPNEPDVIYIGFDVDPSWGTLKKIYALEMKSEKEVRWIFNVTGYGSSSLNIESNNLFSNHNTDQDILPTVKTKIGKGKRSSSSG